MIGTVPSNFIKIEDINWSGKTKNAAILLNSYRYKKSSNHFFLKL